MNDMIQLQPLRWHWQDWVTRHRALHTLCHARPLPICARNPAIALLEVISLWTAETNAWLSSLDDGQRRDVIDLIMAECDMLWQVVDPAAHTPSGYFPDPPTADDRTDFRDRFYTVQPLVVLVAQLNFPHVERAQRALADLDKFATDKEWLP
jgi:hypothetical protein